MKALLENIFSSFSFSQETLTGDALFFFPAERQRVEYYIVCFISKELINRYLSSTEFETVLEAFKQKQASFNDIEKNTSLLICVQMSDLTADCISLKYEMLKMEENDFHFKKYVLPYTDSSLIGFPSDDTILGNINARVNDSDAFNRYFANAYQDEPYFLAIQLFLKLPFLGPFPHEVVPFHPINEIVAQSITSSELQAEYDLAISDFVTDTDWDLVQRNALDPGNDNFEQFLLNFQANES